MKKIYFLLAVPLALTNAAHAGSPDYDSGGGSNMVEKLPADEPPPSSGRDSEKWNNDLGAVEKNTYRGSLGKTIQVRKLSSQERIRELLDSATIKPYETSKQFRDIVDAIKRKDFDSELHGEEIHQIAPNLRERLDALLANEKDGKSVSEELQFKRIPNSMKDYAKNLIPPSDDEYALNMLKNVTKEDWKKLYGDKSPKEVLEDLRVKRLVPALARAQRKLEADNLHKLLLSLKEQRIRDENAFKELKISRSKGDYLDRLEQNSKAPLVGTYIQARVYQQLALKPISTKFVKLSAVSVELADGKVAHSPMPTMDMNKMFCLEKQKLELIQARKEAETKDAFRDYRIHEAQIELQVNNGTESAPVRDQELELPKIGEGILTLHPTFDAQGKCHSIGKAQLVHHFKTVVASQKERDDRAPASAPTAFVVDGPATVEQQLDAAGIDHQTPVEVNGSLQK